MAATGFWAHPVKKLKLGYHRLCGSRAAAAAAASAKVSNSFSKGLTDQQTPSLSPDPFHNQPLSLLALDNGDRAQK